MKIGVICEGPTDYPAITCFFGHALNADGLSPEFFPLFPEMDKTRPNGGWASVLLWLSNNPAQVRIQKYFEGGLFGGALSTEPLNCIILQLDSDVIDDTLFQKFIQDRYNFKISTSETPKLRAAEITKVLSVAAEFDVMTGADRHRHVIAPAVEATETWCVAAFYPQGDHWELLRGDALTNTFMSALEQSEGRQPQIPYARIDKNQSRRRAFCKKHATGSVRIINTCEQFSQALAQLKNIAPSG